MSGRGGLVLRVACALAGAILLTVGVAGDLLGGLCEANCEDDLPPGTLVLGVPALLLIAYAIFGSRRR